METSARHVHNVNHQNTELKCLKESLEANHITIQEELAEIILQQQDEITAPQWAP